VLKEDERPAPFEFFKEASMLNSTEPCNLVAGKTLIIFELICTVLSVKGLNHISPSVSCFVSTGSEKIISIL
jgi:hypothetical protein